MEHRWSLFVTVIPRNAPGQMLDIQDEAPVIGNVRFLAAIARDDFASDYANFILISQDGSDS